MQLHTCRNSQRATQLRSTLRSCLVATQQRRSTSSQLASQAYMQTTRLDSTQGHDGRENISPRARNKSDLFDWHDPFSKAFEILWNTFSLRNIFECLKFIKSPLAFSAKQAKKSVMEKEQVVPPGSSSLQLVKERLSSKSRESSRVGYYVVGAKVTRCPVGDYIWFDLALSNNSAEDC